ncbi:MAG: glycosyltransferase [Motiliproteus sp.]|nr:glycosyltransferase [Motiliproteus sp.]MCW9054247.1 glycosyltransferase [Motiliproteus sp.]
MGKADHLSVVIPLGPQEQTLGRLLGDLLLLPPGTEILFVSCPHNTPFPQQQQITNILKNHRVNWLSAETGRAKQLNLGASKATGRFLWFVHVDSGFGPELVRELITQLDRNPESFHFSPLRFAADGPKSMGLPWMLFNQWGANLRSRWLGVPFGDQGFCLSKQNFEQLGGYPEDAPYGEDHLLLWQARLNGVPLKMGLNSLTTSARKYRAKGWGKLTLLYQWIWIKQAAPLALQLFKQRLTGNKY